MIDIVLFYCVYFSKYNRMIDDEQMQQMNEKQRMEELSRSWNRGKNKQICTVKFLKFSGGNAFKPP